MRVISRFGDYLAMGIVGGFALLLALTWGAEPQEAELVESPVFAVKVPGVQALNPDSGGTATLKVGTKCMLIAAEPPESAIVEVSGQRWRVHRSCVRVLAKD